MRTKQTPLVIVTLAGVLAVGWYAVPKQGPARARGPKAAKQEPQPEPAQEKARAADRKVIRQSSLDFIRVFEKGDAAAVAGFWTTQGEYLADDGTRFRGRAAIAGAYAQFFAKNPRLKLEMNSESLRFVGQDSAVEEGSAKLQKGKSEEPTASRYQILYVRENGRWLMAQLREWPDEGVTVQDIDWLIGTWVAKTKAGEVRSTYQWDESKQFIRMRFVIKEKDRVVTGTQIIGRDPRTDQLRSWLFESEGGIGEASWSLDGKRWILEANGVQADGSELSATNILTPLDKDSFTWQSTDRVLDGEELPDIAPLKVTRVK